MPMDEVICAIEKADSENIQDLINAVFRRYQELFPKWEMVYFALEKEKMKEQREEVLQVLKMAYLLGDEE